MHTQLTGQSQKTQSAPVSSWAVIEIVRFKAKGQNNPVPLPAWFT